METPSAGKRSRKQALLLCAGSFLLISALALTAWFQTPRPIIEAWVEPIFLDRVEVRRYVECETHMLDEETAGKILDCLGRYEWVPRFRYYFPRHMSEIPFEINLDIYSDDIIDGPIRIVLGKDYFWYRSSSQHLAIYYDILDGEALLQEILALTKIER